MEALRHIIPFEPLEDIEFPERLVTGDSNNYAQLLDAIYRSNYHYMRMAKEDITAREHAKRILADQAVVVIRALLETGAMSEHPVECGAFIHTVALDYPKSLVTIHCGQPPYDVRLVPLMVEHVPSMQMLLDKVDFGKHGIFGAMILACLVCKYPNQRTLEIAKLLLKWSQQQQTDSDHKLTVIRLVIRAFPTLVETLVGSESSWTWTDAQQAILSRDICTITEAVKAPLYRRLLSCLIL